jgi:hypothetical protein
VFDHTYKLVTTDGRFVDKDVPAGFAPFGIRNINCDLFVTYAEQDPEKHDEVAGPGNGFVDVFEAFCSTRSRVGTAPFRSETSGVTT